MPISYPLEASRNASLTAAIATALAAFALWFSTTSFKVEPYWLLGAAAGAGIGIVLMQKWPVVLLTGLMFVGNFKNTPAQGISFSDPTMILLLLCGGAILLHLLQALCGMDGWTVRKLFTGQGLVTVLFLLFVLVFAASLAYTPDPQYGKLKLSRFATFEILAFLAPLLLLRTSKHLRQFVIASTLLSIGLVVRDLIGLNHASAGVVEGNTDITHIGDSMLFVSGILITLYHGVARSRWVNYCTIAVLAVGMIAAVARSPIVALLVTILISGCVVPASNSMISKTKLLIAAAVITVVGIAALQWLEGLPWARDKVAWKEAELISLARGSPIANGTISERLSFNASAFEALREHPLSGLGLGGWGLFYSVDVPVRFPHNFVIEVAAEQGVIGLALLVMLLFVLFRSAHRIVGNKELAFLFPVLTFIVIYNMLTGDIENRQLWFWFGMVAAGSRMTLVSSNNFQIGTR